MGLTIKDELKIIKEKCPIVWNKIVVKCCPNTYDTKHELKDRSNYCDGGGLIKECKICWDESLGDNND